MKLNSLQKLAITVYFELSLVNPEMQAEYIRQQFPTDEPSLVNPEMQTDDKQQSSPEDFFWDTLQSTGIELPYLSN